MVSEKSSPLGDADARIHLPSLIGLKTLPDYKLPLHTHSRGVSRGPSLWRTAFFLIGTVCLLLAFVPRRPLSCLLSSCPAPIIRNPAYLITADHGAVASDNKVCSDIGVEVLKDGGNAVDAAISAALCVGTINMFSSGIGGGGFMTVRIPPNETRATSEVFTVDFRETAPKFADKNMFVGNPSAAVIGGLAVAVPGELRGLEEAWKRWHSNLTWRRLVQPSIDLAAGWTVDAELARRIQMFPDLLLQNEDWSAIFAPDGELLLQGDTIRRTNYSRTLEMIADYGPSAFYEGPIADFIVRKVDETGGILIHEDLENYRVKVEHALEGTYRDKKVYTSPAPTAGPVLLHMLNLLERYDLIEEGRTPLNLHRIIEAMKFGFAARTRIGDPDPAFYTGDINRVLEISTKRFADEIAANLTDGYTHPPEYYNPEFDVETDHGTTHISVVDKDGMAVALTSSVNQVFGSQVLDPETGIILNDQMDDFSVPGPPNNSGWRPSPYNYPEPGKRPLSSTSPTIVEYDDGSFYLAIGASGGPQIFPSVFQTFLNLDWEMDASEAVEYGRVHDQLYPVRVTADNVLPPVQIRGLLERGHPVSVLDVNRLSSAVQVVLRKYGQIYAASDSRKHGIAAGY